MNTFSIFNRRQFLSFSLGITLLVSGSSRGKALTKRKWPDNRDADRGEIKSLVVNEASNLGVPASLALAVAHAESNFNPRAESDKGARGVMQIMPATAWGEYCITAEELWNPRVNIRLGLHYLRRLIDRYDGRVEYALSFYNGGFRVGPPSHPRIIPATRSYVRKVTNLRARYHRALQLGQI